MYRRLSTLYSTFCLLLCAALAVLWVRSYRVVDDFALRTKEWALVVRFHRGLGEVYYSVDPVNPPGWTTHTMLEFDDPGTVSGREWSVWGLALPTFFVLATAGVYPARRLLVPRSRGRYRALKLLLVYLALLACAAATMIAGAKTDVTSFWGFAAVVAVAVVLCLDLVRWLRARRITPWPWQWRARLALSRAGRGLCPRCGYDLRASPDRYPECGAAAAADGCGAPPAA